MHISSIIDEMFLQKLDIIEICFHFPFLYMLIFNENSKLTTTHLNCYIFLLVSLNYIFYVTKISVWLHFCYIWPLIWSDLSACYLYSILWCSRFAILTLFFDVYMLSILYVYIYALWMLSYQQSIYYYSLLVYEYQPLLRSLLYIRPMETNDELIYLHATSGNWWWPPCL